jgi:deoxyribonuclease V
MIAFLDVDYRETGAVAACVLARDWVDPTPEREIVERIEHVEPYVPGQFFKRELPCLLAVLKASPPVDVIVVDGYVWLGADHPGLGAHLFEAFEEKIPVIGVAKTRFHSATTAVEVVRGSEAKRPLWVSSAGIDLGVAAQNVRRMHGDYRIPTLIRRVDRLCRSNS